VKTRKFDLLYRRRSGRWVLRERQTRSERVMWGIKRQAVMEAARFVRARAPSQLFVRNRDGRIQKGRNGERSYGIDSRRRPG